MNSKRPYKPNLPSVPKPSKLLLQRGYAEPISSLAYRIPLETIASTNMKLVPSHLLPKHQMAFSQMWVWWEKVLVMNLSRM